MKKIIYSVCTAMLLATAVSAQVPQAINYQAAVRNSSGAPLASSLVQVRFTIHDLTATGATFYQETNTATTTAQGILNTSIGAGTPVTGTMAAINWATGIKFLEVELNTGTGYTSIGTQQMVSVPYALYAASAGNSVWATVDTNIYNVNTGKVGIGTSTPSSMFHTTINGLGTFGVTPVLRGTLMVTGSGGTTSGSGVYAEGGWRGVFGRNKSTSGSVEAVGVYGLVDSASSYFYGMGVKGDASAKGTANYGVFGIANNGTSANYGVYGKGGSAGVFGENAGTGYAYSPSLSTMTPGVAANQTSVSGGYQVGMFARSATTTSTSHAALMAIAENGTGSNYGVIAYTKGGTGSTNYALYASTFSGGTTNYAGYFSGTTYSVYAASGTKSFKIDHPLDPENKYLVHSSVESNDMMNIYNGNATTNATGTASITLPTYFTALNKDFKYQLTCIGTFAQAIIFEEISDNKFVIKTDKPNVKVSWQVAGVRHDQTALKYPIIAEIDKPASEKGFYLVPEAFGFGPERNAAYNASAANKNTEYHTTNVVEEPKANADNTPIKK